MTIIREERIGGQRLILGDSREILEALPKPDAIVTDPPYGIGITKSNRLAVSKGMGGKSWDESPADIAPLLATGAPMIVWGGKNKDRQQQGGGKYEPAANRWSSLPANPLEIGQFLHTAVWTGSEMIVWGGYIDNEMMTASGASYVPATDHWRPISSPIKPRSGHTAIWTGTEMIVWAGVDRDHYLNSGGRYIPAKDEWRSMTQQQAPTPRFGHTTVWTGTEMIVWGGYGSDGVLADDGRVYNPGTDSWSNLSTDRKPEGKILNSLIWTGTEMIIWGGSDGQDLLNSGRQFRPEK